LEVQASNGPYGRCSRKIDLNNAAIAYKLPQCFLAVKTSEGASSIRMQRSRRNIEPGDQSLPSLHPLAQSTFLLAASAT
jgi:hypothetical protein